MPFRRYGGDIETRDLGGAKFADIRFIALAIGIPLCFPVAILNSQISVVLLVSCVAYAILGFIGEFRIKYGYYITNFLAVVSCITSVVFSKPYFVALVVVLIFNLVVVWNAHFLFKRVKR